MPPPRATRRTRPPLAGLLLAAALCAPGAARGLDPTQPLQRYAHNAWSRENGLPSSSIQSLHQGRDGYLWLGTQDGLVRFDGARFAAFTSQDVPEIGNDDVQSIAEGRDGSLWFSTLGGGLVRLHEGRFTAWTTSRGLSSDAVRVLLMGRDGNPWVGTDGGLHHIVGDQVSRWDLSPALGDPIVEALFEDRAGRLWVASRSGGVCVFADGACQPPPLPNGVAPRQVRAILETRDGALWIATDGQGLLRAADGEARWFTADDGLSDDHLTALYEDRAGSLWIGTRGAGLLRHGPTGFEVFGVQEGLSQAYVTALLEDCEDNLWVGTFAGGLNRLQDARIVTYGAREGIAEDVVLSVLQDRLGYVWIGTMQGLFRMHGERVVPFPGEDLLRGVAVTALFEDRTGGLWVGSFGQGLYQHADGAWQTWGAEEGLSTPYVFAVAEDADGRVWVGTQKGLDRLEQERFVPVDAPVGLANRTVRMLHLDRAGRLWVGSDGGGLFRWTPDGFSAPLQAQQTPPNQRKITAAWEESDGTLWFGTEGGVLRVRDGVVDVLTEADGLWEDRIWRVLQDAAGQFWFSTNRGVYRVERAALQERLSGGAPLASLVFGRADGMASSECNGGYVGAGARIDDGRLWFPTTRGVAVVDPARDFRPPLPSPVVIESVTADGVVLDPFGPIALEPRTWRLAIRFTAPAFQAQDKLAFRYALGEQPWSQPDATREASFTNLDPGEYTFRVGSSDGRGGWVPSVTELRFTVLPAFWQTGWFRALVVATGVAAVALVFWVRERGLRARQVELEALVARRTEEITRLAAQQKELSLRDELTGLRNRRFLMETARPVVDAISRQQAERSGGPRSQRRVTLVDRLGLCLVDIDHFKHVNDTWGHDAGDRVLQQFSALLEETARGQDVVVRWGGEEFLLVLYGADEEGLATFAERLRRRAESRSLSLPDGGSLTRTCSLGLLVCPFYAEGEYGLDLEQLVALADLGLYRAKRTGRNRAVIVRPGLRPPASREEAARAFSSVEAATDGGYVELTDVPRG